MSMGVKLAALAGTGTGSDRCSRRRQVRPDVPGPGTKNAGGSMSSGRSRIQPAPLGGRALRMGEPSPSAKSFEGRAVWEGQSFSKAPIVAGGVDIIR
jgi:hypothetical protein